MRLGLVSSAAVGRVGRITSDTMGPGGAVSSRHIEDPGYQRAGAGFGNSERDFGESNFAARGHIDRPANARDYKYSLKAKNPFNRAGWSPRWFNRGVMTKLGDRTSDPESDVGGPSGETRGATGTGWMDRNRRGET